MGSVVQGNGGNREQIAPSPVANPLLGSTVGSNHPSIYMPWHTNVVPIITPIDQDANPIVDRATLSRYISHLKALGNQHLFVLGETGEFRFLSNEQRISFAEAFVPLARAQGLNVYVNATAENYETTLGNYRRWTELKADAIIFAPLWGDNKQVLQDLKDGKFLNGPPIVLYNNPGITRGNNIAAGDIRDVAPFIGALKDSSGDPMRIEIYRAALNTSFAGAPKLYAGDEFLAVDHFHNQAVDGAVGSSGVVCNFLSQLYSPQFNSADLEAFASEFKAAILGISEDRKKSISGLKEILMAQNVIPFARLCVGNEGGELNPETRGRIREIIESKPPWIKAYN